MQWKMSGSSIVLKFDFMTAALLWRSSVRYTSFLSFTWLSKDDPKLKSILRRVASSFLSWQQVLEPQQRAIVYFADSFLWPDRSDYEDYLLLRCIFDQLPEGVAILCPENYSRDESKQEAAKAVQFVSFADGSPTIPYLHVYKLHALEHVQKAWHISWEFMLFKNELFACIALYHVSLYLLLNLLKWKRKMEQSKYTRDIGRYWITIR